MHSWSSRKRSFLVFGLERLIRLSPLFFVALTISSGKFSIRTLLISLFLNPAPRSRNWDPIGVAYTIPIEFWCSLIIPISAYIFSKYAKKSILLYFMIVATLITGISHAFFIYILHFEKVGAESTVFKGIAYVSFGILIFEGEKVLKTELQALNYFVAVFSFFTFLILIKYLINPGDSSIFGVVLVLNIFLLNWQKICRKEYKVNKILILLGNTCFGLYLFHPLIASYFELHLHFVAPVLFLLSVLASVLCGAVSWLTIEKPLITIGRRLLEKV